MPRPPPRPLNLTIVSYPGRVERMFEEAVQRLLSGPAAPGPGGVGPEFVLERCQAPDEVVYLARLWKNRGRAIVRLDLVGHGAGGRFALGDGLLFASDGTGYPLARRLGPKLAPDGVLRLLGCHTAEEPGLGPFSGGRLLADLERLLGRRRRVLGTRGHLRPRHWGPGGLTPEGERLVRGR